ncbi:TM0106 family RecB-like putative nuclease [Sphingosinicella humi]|uniref:DNA/RNA helicase n=1 Tax=Allosphingosinicella humi TaxID=2068657 RepID=A0A2U2J5A8_9SPHN|nr:TM0106 family RecB-like putative nuclease [Sphingosinicella humi]PWG03523.1 DNA/RNA helicase [Sphingosinicella humi]
MRVHNDSLLHSASDLNAFLGCAHAAALNLRKLIEPDSLPDPAEDDESAVLIQQAGHAHEGAYLASLREKGGVIEISSRGTLEKRAAETLDAMRVGAPIIYQATFLDAPWHGFADFLRRVERPSELGGWSYEVIDTKLARTASPKHVLQLALYSEMIAKVQGVRPHGMHLVLGDCREEEFRTTEFRHTLDASTHRYLTFIEGGAQGSVGEPCSSCSLCGWREVCAAEWEAIDHLSRVAGMQKSQIAKLRDAGVSTVAALAALPVGTRVPKLAPSTFERLRAQAVLQVARLTGEPVVEHLPLEEGRGFARLPAPDPADLFFDLEGDPLYPDGLEYLWGVHYRDAAGEPVFRYEWGHDRASERAAFEAMVDWFTEHVAANPHAHIYHYAAYEVTVLRRLSTAFASREAEVDSLLRAEKFVDLYSVARAAIRTSEPNLSLKTLEIFFAEKRAEDVTKADQSIVHYHRWRETGEQALLDGILAYNRVDCENTEGLRDWLLTLRPELPWWTKQGPAPDPEKTAEAIAREARLAALRESVRANATCLSERGRELVAHLIDFHSRAKKPEQWAVFDRCGRDDDELIDDGECIGAIEPVSGTWLRQEKRSTVARYRFPHQDTKLREGSTVVHAPTLMPMGTIVALDRANGFVEVKRVLKGEDTFPQSGSLIPGWPLDTSVLEEAVERVAGTLAAGDGNRYRAIIDLIERAPPRLAGWDGGELVRPDETLIEATTGRAMTLDRSTLFIQGPPGTGKTHTSAHVICALIAAGKRVGVSSNSHKAINNLLAKVEAVAKELGLDFSGMKKVTRGDPDTLLNGGLIEDVTDAKDIEDAMPDLIGGTAWLFAREKMDQALDYLFVDEAGQVSLGHLMAMGAAAKNIILVGDQMQLGQPIQGAHPGESGQSVLDYLLQGAATIAPDKGILLDTSWRMHSSICGFISEAVYDGRLRAHPDNEAQQLLLDETAHDQLSPNGIRMVEMHHSGCSQRSDEEVEVAAELVESLCGQRYVNRRGHEATIGLENILVVAPYNLQVNALKERLPAGARVGTVDKFQGQEAEVVIVSLATSTPGDLPRHVDFFYSKNRLNVAISRARTLAVVLANPKLLELDAKTVEHLRLVNTLAWLRSAATGDAHAG